MNSHKANIREIQLRLLYMAKEVKKILESNKVPYFITYGTLLGAVRHGGFIPWDDDFDFYLFDDSYDKAIELLRENLPDDLFVEDQKSEPLYFHGWAHIKDLNSIAESSLFPQDGFYKHKGLSVDLYRTKLMDEKYEKIYIYQNNLKYLDRRYKSGLLENSIYRTRYNKIESELKTEEQKLKTVEIKEASSKMIFCFISVYNDKLTIDEMFPLKLHKFEDTEFYVPNNYDILLRRCYGDYSKLPPIEKRKPHYSEVILFDN